MPSWSIHLAMAKKLNKKLKLDKDLFFFGNLIPDINYGNKLTRKDTHFNKTFKCKNCPSETLPDINEFLKSYSNKLKDPLILGYYTHLLTDYYFNNYVFTKCWVQNDKNKVVGIKLKNGKIIKTDNNDKTLRKDYKHYDFELYGRNLFKSGIIEVPKLSENIEKSLKLLKDNFFTVELAKKRIDYLNTDFNKFNKISLKEKIFGYKLFYKEELDRIFDNCYKYIIKELKNNIKE